MATQVANSIAPTDHFGFFDLPRKLNIDTGLLEKNFYILSRKLHPDAHAQSSPQEQEWSEEQSSRLNDAYRTLKDPIQRTQYLLKLEGVEMEEQSKSATESARAKGEIKKQIVPPALLEEVFELNMQLEEMRVCKTLGECDPQLIKDVEKQKLHLEKQFDDLAGELKGLWHQWDKVIDQELEGKPNAAERTQVRDKMVDLINRRNYFRNLVRDVNEVLEPSNQQPVPGS
jgi:molecular chaperone HscB